MFSDKVMAEAIARLKAQSKAETARFVMIAEDGRMVNGGTACHGRLSSDEAALAKRVGVVTCTQQLSQSKCLISKNPKYKRAYLDYLMNRSPYQSAFLSKDVDVCLEQDAIAITGHVPSNLMAGACVATRSVWERAGGLVYIFCELNQRGVPEDVAFMLAQTATISSGDEGRTIRWNRNSEDHHPFCPLPFTWECLKNFLTHTPAQPNKTWAESSNYRGLNKLFLSYPEGQSNKRAGEVMKFIIDGYAGKSEVVTNNNPFPRPAPPTSNTPGIFEKAEVAVENMAKFAIEKLIPKIKQETGV